MLFRSIISAKGLLSQSLKSKLCCTCRTYSSKTDNDKSGNNETSLEIKSNIISNHNQISTAAIADEAPDILQKKLCRIYKPCKSVMQSCDGNSRYWRIDFDNNERWENPLVGWASR